MRTTTDLARTTFGEEIAFSGRHGDQEQVTYVIDRLLGEFHANALATTIDLVSDAVMARHAALAGSATDADAMFAVDLPGAEGLAIRLPGGRNVLVAWWNDGDEQYVGVLPWVEPASADLLALVDATIAEGVHSVDDVAALAVEVAGLGSLPFSDLRSAYDDTPVSLADIVAITEKEKLLAVFWGKGIGYRQGHLSDGKLWARPVSGPLRDIELLQDILNAFDLKAARDRKEIVCRQSSPELVTAARSGLLAELYASTYAMVLDRLLETRVADIDALVSGAAELGLSRETCIAYGDGDRIVSVQQLDGRVAWMHNNIDLNEQNVFVTVLTGEPGAWTSIDVFLASPWYRGEFDEEDIWDLDDEGVKTGPMDLRGFYTLAADKANGSFRMGEAALMDDLEAGRMPGHCRVLSYDIAGKSIELYPAAAHTDYGTFLGLIMENDLEAVTKVLAWDMDEIEIRRHDAGAISVDDEVVVDLADLGRVEPATL